MAVELPVPVRSGPYWRIRLRPAEYKPDRLSLPECESIVDARQVRLRGWYYPHVTHRAEAWERGEDFVANHVAFGGHIEYWRMYQSGQFVHLLGVRELI